MVRLLLMALAAVLLFSQIPSIASNWLESNGYMDPAQSRQTTALRGGDQREKKSGKPGYVELKANSHGHYLTKAYLNNKSVRAVIDTGATYLALSYEDARRIGISPRKSDFNKPARTANGIVNYAAAKIRSVRIGNVELYDVEARIAPKGALGINLVGMSFLKKLDKIEVSGGKLILAN